MKFPTSVKIVEVGPRDGLQNEPEIIPTNIKLQFIHALTQSGLSVIEATSFVSPKWIPQMADHVEIMHGLKKDTLARYPVLVPNIKGMEAAIASECKDIAVFTAASETFSRKNTNSSIQESLQQIKEIITIANREKIAVRGYVSCVLGCPYEGEISFEKVTEVTDALYQLGCYEISLGDTIGVGTPLKTQELIHTVSQHVPIKHLAVHLHDTYGQALANIYAALETGIATIDSSVAGLGGCPYAPGASGNVSTEDVVYMLEGMNIKTGVDLMQLIKASEIILAILKRPTRSKTAKAILAKKS